MKIDGGEILFYTSASITLLLTLYLIIKTFIDEGTNIVSKVGLVLGAFAALMTFVYSLSEHSSGNFKEHRDTTFQRSATSNLGLTIDCLNNAAVRADTLLRRTKRTIVTQQDVIKALGNVAKKSATVLSNTRVMLNRAEATLDGLGRLSNTFNNVRVVIHVAYNATGDFTGGTIYAPVSKQYINLTLDSIFTDKRFKRIPDAAGESAKSGAEDFEFGDAILSKSIDPQKAATALFISEYKNLPKSGFAQFFPCIFSAQLGVWQCSNTKKIEERNDKQILTSSYTYRADYGNDFVQAGKVTRSNQVILLEPKTFSETLTFDLDKATNNGNVISVLDLKGKTLMFGIGITATPTIKFVEIYYGDNHSSRLDLNGKRTRMKNNRLVIEM